MKKTLFMLFAASLMMAAPSCKKGENDPMSMKSRKSRMAGEYTITAYEASSTDTDSDGDVTTSTSSLSGNTITTTQVYTASGGGTSVTTTTTTTLDLAEVTMDKDGNYTWTWNTTSVTVEDYQILGTTTTTTTTTISTMTETGMWNFLGKIDEYKNKERAVFNSTRVQSTSQTNSSYVTTLDSDGSTIDSGSTTGDVYSYDNTFGNGESSTVYAIDQLKGKEIILKMESSGTASSSVTSGGTTTTSNSSDESSLTMTLTQK